MAARWIPSEAEASPRRFGRTRGRRRPASATAFCTASPRSPPLASVLLVAGDRLAGLRRAPGRRCGTSAFGFLWSSDWNPVTLRFGALQFVLGTIVTGAAAVVIAAPLSIAIGLFLSELAPRALRGPIGTLVGDARRRAERRRRPLGDPRPRAVDSATTSSRSCARRYGFLPFFDGDPKPGRAAAGDRRADDHDHPDHLVDLPRPLRRRPARPRGGRARRSARRAGRWCAASSLPYAKGGVVAAVILGLGRALGEAIAVTQVIGNAAPPAAGRSTQPGHAREPDREPGTRAPPRPPGRLARLPRGDPARDHARHERQRAAARAPVRAAADGGWIVIELVRRDGPLPPQARQPRRRGGGVGRGADRCRACSCCSSARSS